MVRFLSLILKEDIEFSQSLNALVIPTDTQGGEENSNCLTQMYPRAVHLSSQHIVIIVFYYSLSNAKDFIFCRK
jgi:hypothetical protein